MYDSSSSFFSSPELSQYYHYFSEELCPLYGPIVSGFLFAVAWWIWIDAILINDSNANGKNSSNSSLNFVEYIPGIVATVALLVTNSVRREDIIGEDTSSGCDDEETCR